MAVVSLLAAKEHLNIKGNDFDDKLDGGVAAGQAPAGYIGAAVRAVERLTGPLEPTAVTQTVRGGTAVLDVLPVYTLTSFTDAYGNAVAITGAVADSTTGILTWPASNSPLGLSSTYVIAYQAGRNPVPDDLVLAVKEMLRHIWRGQRGGVQRPSTTGNPNADVSGMPGYLVPNFVAELVAPHALPAFA